jgi:hypothetical protein
LNSRFSEVIAPNNPKSPARQQCEANAQAKLSNALGNVQHQSNVNLFKGAAFGSVLMLRCPCLHVSVGIKMSDYWVERASENQIYSTENDLQV